MLVTSRNSVYSTAMQSMKPAAPGQKWRSSSPRWGRSVAALAVGLTLAGTSVAQPVELTPPKLVQGVAADYPAGERRVEAVRVVLLVTVGVDGLVQDASVDESAGPAFDAAALAAVKAWRFEPALRAGKVVAARIKIPFDFRPPAAAAAAVAAGDDAGKRRAGAGAAPGASSAAGGATKPPAAPPPRHTERDGHDHTQFEDEGEIIVVGRARAPQRGASDFNFRVGELGRLPRGNAGELLKLAPGFFLSNEGGEGHAQQVFVRGFDAGDGQDIEFTVDGVPINQFGNVHANGYADTHFIIPELVEELRVLQGPFEPQQGNFAVAGSADYRLGLDQRGLTLKYTAGSFNTQRLLLLWGPRNESHHTFGGAEIYETDGFGQSRASRRGSGIGQYEARIGRTGLWRITGQAYAIDYKSAGALREDDFQAGNKGFFDTYDDWQGGQASRFSISSDVEQKSGGTLFKQQVFVVDSSTRLKENFTGFVSDPQQPWQRPHGQRGDRLAVQADVATLGARGSARWHTTALGQRQEFELGYFARGDSSTGAVERVQVSNAVPYAKELDLEARTANVAVYADSSLKPAPWLNLKGGLRGELVTYDVLNRCAVGEPVLPPGNGVDGDAGCFSQQPDGAYRLPGQRDTTSGSTLLPRALAVFGPFEGFSLSTAWGRGVRAIDPELVGQDAEAPFSSLTAYEGAVVFARQLGDVALVARSIFFQTEVEREYVFDETAGRDTLVPGTTRTGWVGALRATGDWFDVSSSLTLVRSVFDDTQLPIPYVPPSVARADAALFGDLPLRFGGAALSATGSLGFTYVAPRPLPHDELSDPIATLDAAASVGWKSVEVGLEVNNVLDSHYRLGEYNYPSDFRAQATPSLEPVRHFNPGPPRSVFATLTLRWGES